MKVSHMEDVDSLPSNYEDYPEVDEAELDEWIAKAAKENMWIWEGVSNCWLHCTFVERLVEFNQEKELTKNRIEFDQTHYL